MLDAIVHTVFPLRCPGCGRAAEPVCVRCAEALVPCEPAPPPPGVDRWIAPFSYEGVVREVIARVKYRRAHAATAWLAEAMARLVAPPLPSVITWVPTTRDRRRERGFDHAELLARRLARPIRRPCRQLLRRGDESPQTGRSGAARRIGPVLAAHGSVPAHVLVVDDVATTGASLSSAAAALRAAGAAGVDAVTAARTPKPW
jgi:ComF family protein